MDHVIYRDYIVNRRFLFTVVWPVHDFLFSFFSFSFFWLGNHLDRSIWTVYCKHCPNIALLSPFLFYSGANGRASVSVFKPTADFEQTTHFDQLFAVLSV